MRYWIGPWQYLQQPDERPTGWNAPLGTSAVVDLRSRQDAGRDTLGERPYGFFAGPDGLMLPSEYELLARGDCREVAVTGAMQSTWQGLLGYRPQGERLVDLLWDQLTDGASPDGEGGVAPLVPTASGDVQLRLQGHSIVKRLKYGDRVRRGGRWAAVLTEQLRRQFSRQFRRKRDVAEKMLGNWQAKYRLGDDWRHLVRGSLRHQTRGPRRPETSYSDDFNRASLGASWTFGAGLGYQIYASSGVGCTTGGFRQCEYASDLSSDDHWSQVTWTPSPSGLNFGPVARSSDPSSAVTQDYYYTQRFGGQTYATKIVNGSQTNLANAASSSTASGDVDRIQADGSNLSASTNGSEDVTVTDTSLAGQLRAGLYVVTYAGDAFTSWAAEDIAAGGGGGALPMAATHYRRLRT